MITEKFPMYASKIALHSAKQFFKKLRVSLLIGIEERFLK
jgi:hypothetical protein